MTSRITIVALFFCITQFQLEAFSAPISFQWAGKLMVIKATVNGQLGNFILDTGTSHLVLNDQYFKGKHTDKIFHGMNGQTGTIQEDFVKVDIGQHRWKSAYAEIIPLAHLEKIKGLPIHGLIGGKMFRSYAMWIDCSTQEIGLQKIGKQSLSPGFYPQETDLEVQYFRYKENSPCIQLQIGEHSLLFSLDTGAETNLIDQKYESLLADYYNLSRKRHLNSFSPDRQTLNTTKLYDMKLGPFSCQPMNTIFTSLSKWNTSTSGPKVAGILGYEFLHQFRISINFKEREICFAPTTPSTGLPQYTTKK